MRLKLPFRNSYIKLGNITTSLKIPKKVKTPTKRSFYVVPHKAIGAVVKKIKIMEITAAWFKCLGVERCFRFDSRPS